MFWVVFAQGFCTVSAGFVAAVIGGRYAAITALLTGLACVVPNGMFATHLILLNKWQTISTAQSSSAMASSAQARTFAILMLFGEFMKVILTVALLAAVFLGYRHAVWKALLITLGACLLVQPLAHHWRPSRHQ
jgi:ATP synthase protein I